MDRYDANRKAEKKYDNLFLQYDLNQKQEYEKINKANLEKVQQALSDVGVSLDIRDNTLRLSINSISYNSSKTRYAGRRKKLFAKGNDGYYRYSDVVYMMQSMIDQDIADTIGIPIATYRRHKKDMLDSEYYQTLDKNRLSDREYLDKHDDNFYF